MTLLPLRIDYQRSRSLKSPLRKRVEVASRMPGANGCLSISGSPSGAHSLGHCFWEWTVRKTNFAIYLEQFTSGKLQSLLAFLCISFHLFADAPGPKGSKWDNVISNKCWQLQVGPCISVYPPKVNPAELKMKLGKDLGLQVVAQSQNFSSLKCCRHHFELLKMSP